MCLQSKQTDENCSKKMQGSHFCNEELVLMTSSKNRRMPARRNRAVPSLNRCSFIPISSPAGQKLLKTMKQTISLEYVFERQERIDRFCYTPLIHKSSCKYKPFEKKLTPSNVHISYKKCHDNSSHIYAFPRRQFSQRRDTTQNFLFLNSPLIKQCRPILVRLKKITESIGEHHSENNTKINIRLTRDSSHSSRWRISPSNEIVDTIDLCSSDDDDQLISSSQILNSDTFSIISLSREEKAASKLQNTPMEKQCTSISLTSDINSLKPLQQSVYIFSNYKTNSVFNRVSLKSKTSSSDKTVNITNTFLPSNNQENCNLQKKVKIVSDWCSESTNSGKNDISLADKSVSTVQPFNSSGRIISIDLTT